MKVQYADFARAIANFISAPKFTSIMVRSLVLATACLVSLPGCDSRQEHAKATASSSLTKVTREVLQKLNKPIEIRFYSLLDRDTVPAETVAFAERTKSLLETYRDASAGKIQLATIDSQSDSNIASAIADGIRAFNLDKGDASFLGVSVRVGEAKETLPLLSADYESALQADITRAITRASDLDKAPAAVANAESELATPETIKAVVPNYASISLEAGANLIRESMLQELTKQAQEGQAKAAEAQATLERARQSGSQAEQEAAQTALAQAEKENADRIQEIVARSTAQIRGLEKLKSQPR